MTTKFYLSIESSTLEAAKHERKGRGVIKAPGHRRDLDLRLQPRIIAGVGEEGRKGDQRANLGRIVGEKRPSRVRGENGHGEERQRAIKEVDGEHARRRGLRRRKLRSRRRRASDAGRVVGESRRSGATPGKEKERERERKG